MVPKLPDINFTNAAFRHRLTQGGGRGQALAKAVGLTKGRTPDIIDATAGLGRDGFVLAHLGAKVTLIERSAAIARALELALKQAKAAEPLFAEPASRITLLFGDARQVLAGLAPSTVYIDPMHPARLKSALVKQQMRQLREVVGSDDDSALLIQAALLHARKRVVVKWPMLSALPDTIPNPSSTLSGKTTKYLIFAR